MENFRRPPPGGGGGGPRGPRVHGFRRMGKL